MKKVVLAVYECATARPVYNFPPGLIQKTNLSIGHAPYIRDFYLLTSLDLDCAP